MPPASILTEALQRRVVAGIQSGLHIERAARAAGISETTFYRWMEQGHPDSAAQAPPLANMGTKELRLLAKSHEVPIGARTSRANLLTALTDAGVNTWERCRAFREAVEEAEAALEQRLVAQWQLTMQPLTRMEKNAEGEEVEVIVRHANFQSTATFLARRFPEKWSQALALELAGKDGGPISISVTREATIAATVKAYLQGIEDGEHEEAQA